MKTLITGCNGLVACRLAKKLADYNISAFGLSQNGLTNPYILPENYFQIDICDTNKISNLFDQLQPDAIVHTAAITKPDICELNPELCNQINYIAAVNLLHEASRREIYTIHLSTDFVFAGEASEHDENSIDFPPVNIYGKSKYKVEKFVKENLSNIAIVRTALVYGFEPLLPRSNIFTWALDSLKNERVIRVVDDQFRTPTFADDLADGLFKLCQKRLSGIFHIAGIEFLSVYDFVCKVAEVYNFNKALIIPVKTASLHEPALRPPSTNLCIEKAKRDLEYLPNPVYVNLQNLRRKF